MLQHPVPFLTETLCILPPLTIRPDGLAVDWFVSSFSNGVSSLLIEFVLQDRYSCTGDR